VAQAASGVCATRSGGRWLDFVGRRQCAALSATASPLRGFAATRPGDSCPLPCVGRNAGGGPTFGWANIPKVYSAAACRRGGTRAAVT